MTETLKNSIANLMLLTIFPRRSMLDTWQGQESVSAGGSNTVCKIQTKSPRQQVKVALI